MLCTSCRHDNPERAKFCLECGHRMATGESVAPAALARSIAPQPPSPYEQRLRAYTPKHLAEKILKSRSAIEGERRQVTVLFADLADFHGARREARPGGRASNQSVASRLADPGLHQAFLSWSRVQAASDHCTRLRRPRPLKRASNRGVWGARAS